MSEKAEPTLRYLYPKLNEQQFMEVEDALDRYLALTLRIFERMEMGGEERQGRLTQKNVCGTMSYVSLYMV